MASQYLITNILNYENRAGYILDHNRDYFPVLMHNRHRDRFLEYIEDLYKIGFKPTDRFCFHVGVSSATTDYLLDDIQTALTHAETNPIVVAGCLRLNIGLNRLTDLDPGHVNKVRLLHPIITNMQCDDIESLNFVCFDYAKHAEFSAFNPHELMQKYKIVIQEKYRPEFFEFNPDDWKMMKMLRGM